MSKSAIQASGSKRQNMAQNQKNIAQNPFPNECKAIIYLVDIKVEINTQVPENSP